MPDALFVFTDALVIIDNLRSQARVVVGAPLGDDTSDADAARGVRRARWRTVERTIAKLRDADRRCRRSTCAPTRRRPRATSNYDARASSSPTWSASSEYIVAGDAFQVLLGAAHPRCRTTSRREALYRALRALNPSPYMYHLVLDGVELVGSSPELLVRVRRWHA